MGLISRVSSRTYRDRDSKNQLTKKMGNQINKAKADLAASLEEKSNHMVKTQLSSRLAMQNEMRQRQLAMQIGINRERFQYYNIFYLGLSPLLLIGSIKTK